MKEQNLKRAVELLKEDAERTCVIVWDEKETYLSKEKGIRPLMEQFEGTNDPFLGGAIADKVFGRAAAFLAVYGKAEAVYANVISKPACELLRDHGIVCEYEEMVPYIVNRAGTGQCPMEQAVWEINDCETAYKVLKEKTRRQD